MRPPKRPLPVLIALITLLSTAMSAVAQPATPVDPETTLEDHVAWVVSLFDGAAANLTPDDVEARFDAQFIELIPPEELIASVQQLAGAFGPIELVEELSNASGEFIGLYRSESGDGLMVSVAIDPETGVISGFFITVAPLPTAATPGASPSASPVAAEPVIDDPEVQIARYQDQIAEIRAVAEPAVDAVLAGDDDALAPLLSTQMAQVIRSTPISTVIDSYTTRQVRMTYAESGAHFFGQWNTDRISGVMIQRGTPYVFELTAEMPQQGDEPSGAWNGELMALGLEIHVTFGSDAQGALTATLDIPAQEIVGAELIDVRYRAAQPIGEVVQQRAFAPSALNNSFAADVAWGDGLLRVSVAVDAESEQITGLQVLPAVPSPPAPDAPKPVGIYQLPFDGTWWVFWGGDTELRNYHIAYPPQRYAYDFAIWKDGGTYHGDGSANEHYWAWGQPALAPVNGEVIRVVDEVEDQAPNASPAERAAGGAAGNHVVIRVSDAEYVIVAHLQRGSVRVQAGDHVEAGDLLGLVGNSGNSSEPHVHIHVQTSPDVEDPDATAIPLPFDTIQVNGEPAQGAVPVQGSFVANP